MIYSVEMKILRVCNNIREKMNDLKATPFHFDAQKQLNVHWFRINFVAKLQFDNATTSSKGNKSKDRNLSFSSDEIASFISVYMDFKIMNEFVWFYLLQQYLIHFYMLCQYDQFFSHHLCQMRSIVVNW